MAHPFSWPSYISHEHLIHDSLLDRERNHDRDRERDRYFRGHISPLPWSPSERHFYAPRSRTPSRHISTTQPFEPTISLLPSHQTLAISREESISPTTKPKMTFKATLESLENSNIKAHGFFIKFHHSFSEDISPNLRIYATRPSLDINWAAKIQHHEIKSHATTPQHQNQTEDAGNYSRDVSFLELRDELLHRCISTANLKVPHWPLVALDDLERRNSAEAMVAKLTASIRTLMPNLQRCDRSVSAMKAALSEMVTIANILTCHDDGRDGEGIRREENDGGVEEGGEGSN